MNKHDPLNRKCLQNCVVNRGARVSCAHLHHDCTCPAQKEDPFGDFMKSQGINVVDVTPTQKEEWVAELRYLMTEEVNWDALKDLIRSQIALAEARGRLSTITAFEEAIKNMQFHLNVDEYLPMVEAWDRKNYDKPFDDGYAKAKSDLLKFASSLKSNAPKV